MASLSRSPLVVEGLDFAYGSRPVFHDFQFTTNGRLVLLRGPSGCGKTTLLKLLAGLVAPSRATALSVQHGALMIVQEDALAPWLTGMQNITKFTSITPAQVQAQNGREFVGDLLDQLAGEMSFGQRRIVELFRAILLSPPILLLDEPFNFLDPQSRGKFCSLLFDEAFLQQTRVVVTSHYKEDFDGISLSEFVFDGSTPVTKLVEVER